MNSVQAAQYDSIIAVRQLLGAAPAVTAAMPALATAFTEFSGKVTALEASITQQDADYSGNTLAKAGARQAVIDQLLPLAAATYAMARVTGNEDLAGEVKTTPTELRNMRDDEFRGRADRILKAIRKQPAAALTPYNVTPDALDNVDDAFAGWQSLQSTVRQGIALSEAATRRISALLPEIQGYLATRMDPMMLAVAAQHPDVAAQYEIVREIVDPATQTRALTVTVTTIQGGPQPVEGAEGAINPGGLHKTTGPQGQFYVQDLAPGAYTLSVSKAGYAPQGPVPFTVVAGEMAGVTVVLEPA